MTHHITLPAKPIDAQPVTRAQALPEVVEPEYRPELIEILRQTPRKELLDLSSGFPQLVVPISNELICRYNSTTPIAWQECTMPNPSNRQLGH